MTMYNYFTFAGPYLIFILFPKLIFKFRKKNNEINLFFSFQQKNGLTISKFVINLHLQVLTIFATVDG